MDSNWKLIWTWINGKDFTVTVKFSHSSPLKIRFSCPITEGTFHAISFPIWGIPLAPALRVFFFRVLYCTPSGSFQTVIAQTWQGTICRFSLFSWKFLLYELYELEKSLSWESVSQRKYESAVICDFHFFPGFYKWYSTVTLKQNSFVSVSCKISKGIQRVTSSLIPLKTSHLPCLLGPCWHFLTGSKYQCLFHKSSGPKKFFFKWMADET